MTRKLFTLIGLVVLSLSASAQLTSPFTGTTVGNGEFYLYNIKSGLWLQNNDSRSSEWTTRANVGTRGINFKLQSKDNGYMIGAHFNDRPSIWPYDNYLDYHSEEKVWNFEPVSVAGLSNVYRIVYYERSDDLCKLGTVNYNETWKANNLFTQEGDGRWYLENVYYWNSDMGDREYWQVVSRDERIAWMQNVASTSNPVDASWLIDDPDFSVNNDRLSSWHCTTTQGNSRLVGNEDNDSSRGNAVYELWRDVNDEAFDFYQELSNIPNGVYRLQIQGFCRDGEFNEFTNGEMPAEYYAGSASHKIKSFFADAKDSQSGDWANERDGKWFPNGTERASRVINREKAYVNEPIEVTVTDNSLRIGVRKNGHTGKKDWVVIDNFKLTYLGKTNEELTRELYEAEKSVSENAAYATPFEPAANDANYLAKLRAARKILHAERHDYPFTSVDPEDGGNYYLYNVGQKQFFCGGAKWGAHAALGWPGVEVTLHTSGDGFTIDTHLNNGGTSQWLNWQGWGDTGNQDAWKFDKLANGNYIIRAADPKFILGFYPERPLEENFYFDHVNDYSTDNDWVSEDDLNNQWMLVTKQQRDALLEEATEESPIDASHLIKMPNFSQREYVFSGTDRWNNVANSGAWTVTNGSIFGRGNDYEDFALEAYNQSTFSTQQTITNLPPGLYKMTLNGYYRDRGHSDYYNFIGGGGTPSTPVKLYVNNTEAATLPAIETGVEKAPGLGTITNGYGEVPNNPFQATQYFQNGCYQVETEVFEIGSNGTLTFEVKKDSKPNDNDWVVVDNFRLIYFGGLLSDDGTGDANIRYLKGKWDATRFATIDAEKKALVYNVQNVTSVGTGTTVTTENPNALFITKDAATFVKNTIKWNTAAGATSNYIAVSPIVFTDGYDLNTSTLYNFTANQGVSYGRTLSKLMYSTLVIPYNIAVPTGMRAYEISSQQETSTGDLSISFREVQTIEAGKPYLLRPSTTDLAFNIPSGTAATVNFALVNDETNAARGTYTKFKNAKNTAEWNRTYTIPGGENAVSPESEQIALKRTTGNIGAFRVYFLFEKATGDAKVSITIDDTTGIRELSSEELGELFNVYSIDGKKVRQQSESLLGLPSGIYVVNGKKVVVK